VPDHPWQEVLIDFITDLPESKGCINIMVITDQLTKGVILEGMSEIDSESVAWALVRVLISKHGIPKAITLDRGSQFTSNTWACIYTLTGINC
jgi:hypothetical protein